MGFLKSTSSTRCRYAGCFALGFVVATLIFAAMFWILWCYFGLTIVQISDTQRRALVNYSYTTAKPPTTSSPSNRTEVDGALESSLNAISKTLATPPSQPRRRVDSSVDLAKGDFAARSQGGTAQNSTRREPIISSVTSSNHERKASILTGGEEDGLHHRKVSTSNKENRPHEESLPAIKPTQTYAPAQSDPFPTVPKDERRPISKDSDRRDEIGNSRPPFRKPDFESESPPRRSDSERRRYDVEDDDYDDRGSRSRYDKRDRGRETDDRYSKGDTRVYPDERPRLDDRYPPRDSKRRRGDDRDPEERYRDRDVRYRDYEDRYKDRDDRYSFRDDPYKDDEKYRNDKTYLDEDRNRRRDRVEYDDYRPKDDRYRYDDRYRPRDDRYRDDDDRYRDSGYDDKRDGYIPKDDDDRYTRSRDRDSREPIMSSRVDIPSDRKSGRPEDARRPSDYDIPIRERPRTSYIDESRTDDRYINREDEYRRPSKYDDRDRISPTRTKDESYVFRSTVPMSRSNDDSYKLGPSVVEERRINDDRYSSSRDRSKYFDNDNHREDSRYISPSSVRETDSTRRDSGRDDYRTKLPEDKKLDDVGLERRSYSAEEEEYRRQNSRTRYYEDADRKPSGDSRRDYRVDDDYPRRTRKDDDEYRRSRPRGDYDTDRSRDPDTYDRRFDTDDRSSRRYLPEYDEPRKRSEADIGLRKESYPRNIEDEDRTSRRAESSRPLPPAKDRRYDDDIPPRRFISDDRPSRSRSDTVDERPLRPAVERATEDGRRYRDDAYSEDDRRYKDVSVNPDDSSRYIPPRSEKRDSFISSSTSPRDVVVREKRYHDSGRNFDGYGNEEERPINAKDVIDAALKHSDAPNPNPRKVSYPVFDPRVSNLTLSDFIPPSDRRGTTIMSRRKRSRTY